MSFFVGKLIFLLVVSTFISCSNLKKDPNWIYSYKLMTKLEKLQIGDILIKDKLLFNPIGWWGHMGIFVDNYDIVNYPRLFAGRERVNVLDWLNEKRNISVLRYKYMNNYFKDRLLFNIEKYKDRPYMVNFDKNNDRFFYCSSYVWFMFSKTAREVGDTHFDYNFKKNNFIIFPYDFFEIPNFKVIKLN